MFKSCENCKFKDELYNSCINCDEFNSNWQFNKNIDLDLVEKCETLEALNYVLEVRLSAALNAITEIKSTNDWLKKRHCHPSKILTDKINDSFWNMEK